MVLSFLLPTLLPVVLASPAFADSEPTHVEMPNAGNSEATQPLSILGLSADDTLTFGGRIMFDVATGGFDDEEDGTEFRRARIFLKGSAGEGVGYKVQYDFAGGDADLKDAYITYANTPLGKIKVGHFKEPFGLDQQTSSKYITFMERNLGDALSPGRNAGVLFSGNGEAVNHTWALGYFRESDSYGYEQGDGAGALTGRVTAAPILDEDRVLHLGLAVRSASAGTSFSTRPEAHLSTRKAKSNAIGSHKRLGLESAWVSGPLSVQAEFAQVDVDDSDETFTSHYLAGSYFLTGESRPYKKSAAAFDRVKPITPYGKDGGLGAIELTARVSSIDLEDSAGDAVDDLTLGVNYYLSSHSRIMVNYIDTDFTDNSVEESADMLLFRFQVDF